MESTRSSFIKARQRGQQALSALALHTTILFSKQTLQNVCRHGMVFGSVNKSLQIEHVTSSSSTSCKKSLIIQLSSQPLLSHMTRYFLQRRPLGRSPLHCAYNGLLLRVQIFATPTNSLQQKFLHLLSQECPKKCFIHSKI